MVPSPTEETEEIEVFFSVVRLDKLRKFSYTEDRTSYAHRSEIMRKMLINEVISYE